MSNYAKIKTFDIANGNGIRTSVFFSGCEHCCKNCFNNELWDFNVGEQFTRKIYENNIKPTINNHIAGLSVLGGEPMHSNNLMSTICLVKWFKEDFPNKNIWLWTGYMWEELTNQSNENYENNLMILQYVDVLVDGRYVEDLKDLTLKFKGSSNQRVIDVQKTLKENKIVLYN